MDFKISCLLFIRNTKDEILMIKRNKTPNKTRGAGPASSRLDARQRFCS